MVRDEHNNLTELGGLLNTFRSEGKQGSYKKLSHLLSTVVPEELQGKFEAWVKGLAQKAEQNEATIRRETIRKIIGRFFPEHPVVKYANGIRQNIPDWKVRYQISGADVEEAYEEARANTHNGQLASKVSITRCFQTYYQNRDSEIEAEEGTVFGM